LRFLGGDSSSNSRIDQVRFREFKHFNRLFVADGWKVVQKFSQGVAALEILEQGSLQEREFPQTPGCHA
jgi:hypothetical protein